MENSNKIVPPHLNAEVYRSDTTGTSTMSYFDHISINEENRVLIGCSELTGRYWNGGAIIHTSVSEGKNPQNIPKKNIHLSSGTADGCFLGKLDKLLLCQDNGSVSIWSSSCDEVWKMWSEDVSVAEHDDAVLAVDCLTPETEYVTAGADGNIKVWDVNEMICTHNYIAAHSMSICGVAVLPNSKSFVTGSLDEYISLWDEVVDKPIVDLVKNDCGVRCVQWINENKLIFGDESGVLSLVDARNPKSIIRLKEFPAAVHRIAINRNSDKVAVCCDNKIVSVCAINADDSAEVIYYDRHTHGNIVRGLAWDGREDLVLHTVGWDGEMKSHDIVTN
ncbi:methylosome protein WDR77-like [Plodia interpunctella]|uniref:methylosome protein WDR77-like n=1 Tax=Plodia interpunctella TaxID=58824 RepID=UPI002368EFD9|nr:methylosome protein 50-like [Plodia interpunctella]